MNDLSPAQEIFCQHRANGRLVKAAATATGVAESTAYEWNRSPPVQARIRALQEGAAERALVRFRAKADRAADMVLRCMESGRTSAVGELNLKAALAVLKFVGQDSLVDTRRQEVTGRDGGPVVIDDGLSDDERAARLAALLDGARARRDGGAAADEQEPAPP